MIVSALFILLTIIYPQATGMVGSFVVGTCLWYVFGKAMYLFPLFLGLSGLLLLFAKQVHNYTLRIIGMTWLIVNFSIVAEIFSSEQLVQFVFPLTDVQGGYIGNLLGIALQSIFGPVGTYFILLVCTFVASLLALDLGLGDFLVWLKRSIVPVKQPGRVQPIKPVRRPAKVQPVQMSPAKEENKNRNNVAHFLKDIFGLEESHGQVRTNPQRMAASQPMRPIRSQPVQRVAEAPMIAHQPRPLAGYNIPPLNLLKPPVQFRENQRQIDAQFENDKGVLEGTLASFNVAAKVCNVSRGPSVTRYELMPAPGVRVNKIANLADDISLTMASTVRIEAPVPGKSVVGIEVPNSHTRPVNLSELTSYPEFNKHPLTVALGLDIAGKPIYCNLHEMPHLLIAGATGSGKSVCINSLIMSLLLKASPKDVKFLMIDPKRVELANFNAIPHLIAPVIHEPQLAQLVLKLWAIKEMEKRYEIFAKSGVRNIEGYNKLAERNPNRVITINQEIKGETKVVQYKIEPLPYVVIIIDELADLMMVGSREVEASICRIAQMARATGMHLIIATQRPSVDVITGLIKANVPSRVAFAVGSHIDSRTIIDGMGAEKLLGKGDMLYSPVGARHLTRIQGVYVSDEEILRVTNFIKRQAGPAYEFELGQIKQEARELEVAKSRGEDNNGEFSPNQRDDGRDVLFDDAAKLISSTGRKSISFIQRKFRIGYNRAARIMEELEEAGMVNISQ